MGKSRRCAWCLAFKKKEKKKKKLIFDPRHFPLHLKVKLCISKANRSHVSYFFPLTANCYERAHCHIKDFQNVIFIPNKKTIFFSKHITTSRLKGTYIRVSTHISWRQSQPIFSWSAHILSGVSCHPISAVSRFTFIKSSLRARHVLGYALHKCQF